MKRKSSVLYFFGLQPSTSPSTEDVSSLNRPFWIPDSAAYYCQECTAKFDLILRRHHCRGCGRVLCAHCSQKRMEIPSMNYPIPVRVCEKCYINLNGQSS